MARLIQLTTLLLISGLFLASIGQAAPIRRPAENHRSLALGGTGVSYANDELAFYYNPAGLGSIENFWVELLPVTLEASGQAVDLVKSGEFAKFKDPAAMVKKNIGQEIQLRGLFTPHAVFNLAPGFTLGYGQLIEYQAEMKIRNQATPRIEAFYQEEKGKVMGLSFPMKSGKYLGGVVARTIERTGGSADISSASLAIASIKGQLDLKDELAMNSTSGSAYDAGLIWRMEWLSSLRGQFGLSIMNLGGTTLTPTNDTSQIVEIPQEINLGWAFRPKITPLTSLMIAMELRDITAQQSPDSSRSKRTHVGVEFGVLPMDNSTNLITLRMGQSAGAPSYGAELSLWHSFSVSYVVYHEEYGDVAGEDTRQRKLLQVNLIGF